VHVGRFVARFVGRFQDGPSQKNRAKSINYMILLKERTHELAASGSAITSFLLQIT
jgi:hypothetical protein